MKTTDAARLLSIPTREVADVAESPAGWVISTVDGAAYIVVPDDQPDYEGKTGVMLLAAPSEGPVDVVDGRTVWNGFPVYASAVALVDEDEADVAAPDDVDDNAAPKFDPEALRADLEGRPHDELKAMAIELELDVALTAKAPIVDAIVADAVAKAADAEADEQGGAA